MMKYLTIALIAFSCLALFAQAQDSIAQQTTDGTEPEAEQRVQYTLILPEEKTPELIKSDENNPFEVAVGVTEKDGDSEENRVRDILISMPAVGGGSGPAGMRVMLGGLRLEVGQQVPDVIPDQQVILRVKSINSELIELVWVEKTPTGLPPKPFVIPVDVSPSVRYKMPTGGADKSGGATGTIRRSEVSAFKRQLNTDSAALGNVGRPVVKAVSVEDQPVKSKEESPPPTNVPEASVLRMLFGNHGPQPK
jgi:hypothetical protein